MKRHCEECQRKIHTIIQGRTRRYGVESREDHDLCHRCYRRLRQRVVAARMMPKPLWAYRERSTLWLLEAGPAAFISMVNKHMTTYKHLGSFRACNAMRVGRCAHYSYRQP